jgi:hypothetical protein
MELGRRKTMQTKRQVNCRISSELQLQEDHNHPQDHENTGD